MNYKAVNDYFKDISQHIGVAAKYFHGRLFDAALTTQDKGLYVHSLPFTSNGIISNGYQVQETWNAIIIFYQQDRLDSFLDQNNQEVTQKEIETIQITEQLASRFLRLVNQNDISQELRNASDKIDIPSFVKGTAIKDTDAMLTGTVLTLNFRVGDDFDYCCIE